MLNIYKTIVKALCVVPYFDYQSYAFHQLFPKQEMETHPILHEPMVCSWKIEYWIGDGRQYMNALLMAISYIFVFCYTLVMLILVEVIMIWKRGNAARSTDIKGFYTSKQWRCLINWWPTNCSLNHWFRH
jgi:hypothetical protein